MYCVDVRKAYGAALLYEPGDDSRANEPGSNTEPTKMLDELDLVALVDKMRDVSVGEGMSNAQSITPVLERAMGEAGDPFCSAEDRPVGFGAVGSSQRSV